MKVYHTIMPREIIHGIEIYMNAIILENNGNLLVCQNFQKSSKGKLSLLVWIAAEKKWVKTFAKDEYTKSMWQYYYKLRRKSRCKVNASQFMKHDRVHKHKSGGTRLWSNNVVTDYECSKNTFHDFPRVRYVQWN